MSSEILSTLKAVRGMAQSYGNKAREIAAAEGEKCETFRINASISARLQYAADLIRDAYTRKESRHIWRKFKPDIPVTAWILPPAEDGTHPPILAEIMTDDLDEQEIEYAIAQINADIEDWWKMGEPCASRC